MDHYDPTYLSYPDDGAYYLSEMKPEMISVKFEPSPPASPVAAVVDTETEDSSKKKPKKKKKGANPVPKPPPRPSVCPFPECGKVFPRPSALARHWASHTLPYECRLCGKVFSREGNLLKHTKNRHHPKVPLRCLYCNQPYKSELRLKKHLLLHTQSAIEVEDRTSLVDHDYTVHVWEPPTPPSDLATAEEKKEDIEVKPFLYHCTYPGCPRVCTKKGPMFVHMMTHEKKEKSDQIPSSPSESGTVVQELLKLTPKRMSIEERIASMTPTGPHMCHFPGCGKVFKQRNSLFNHIKVHPGVAHQAPVYQLHPTVAQFAVSDAVSKTHYCLYPDCGKSFKRKQALHKHMGTHVPTYRCEVCPKTFSNKYKLRDHLRRHLKKKPFKCRDCGNDYACKASLLTHECPLAAQSTALDVKPFKCTSCNAAFHREASLLYHIVKHTEDRGSFRCQFCFLEFTKKANLELHTQSDHLGQFNGSSLGSSSI